MKTLMATLILFASFSAQASSGQQFREDVRNMARANNLKVTGQISEQGKVCGFRGDEIEIITVESSTEAYIVTADSFYSSLGEDNPADTAVLTEVEGCGKKTVRF